LTGGEAIKDNQVHAPEIAIPALAPTTELLSAWRFATAGG
jgi:hypothetical protein